MRVVIVGCGRAGAHLARTLAAQEHQVTVVDQNRQSFVRLGPDFPGKIVVGVGIDEDVLKQAGIEQADVFVAVTNGDNTNLMAAQVAREVFGIRRVICRVYDPLRAEIFGEMGVETICPTLWSATQIKSLLEGQE